MWREHLEPFRGSTPYPLAWHIWEMKIAASDLAIAEITNAKKWVELVENYGFYSDGLIYPNWGEVAREFSAVHVTLPAIVAAQGFSFETNDGLIAPAFWDIEMTLWLRWCFDSAQLLETVEESS
jgi:hypothetical protein